LRCTPSIDDLQESALSSRTHKISNDFLNIRGSFKVGGLIDVGTQTSLVRRANGKCVFLDSYTPDDDTQPEIDALTNGGNDVEAILNLHPFHTVHVRAMHRRYPRAKLYGTARHLARFPDLPWQKTRTEQPRLHNMFEEDFEFSVPRGVDFISANENVHFSSVLVLHRASKTIHVDDTLMYVRLPLPVRMIGFQDLMFFHPTLRQALEKRAGAGEEFREWAEQLAAHWRHAKNLCAAHTSALLAAHNHGASIHDRILAALRKVSLALAAR
jgi:hypothetical protein